MEALYLLIPLSVVAVFGIVAILWRAAEGGQFDDLVGPAHQVLMDDDQTASRTTPPDFDIPQTRAARDR